MGGPEEAGGPSILSRAEAAGVQGRDHLSRHGQNLR